MSALKIHSVSASKMVSVAKYPSVFDKYQSGFSLIELMIVIAIISVMVVIAAPNIKHALEVQRNKDLSETLVSALKEARTEALFRHQNIKVTYDSVNVKLEQTIPPKTGSALIRTYPLRKGSVMTPNADSIVFGANKSVKFQATGGGDYAIFTKCDAEGTKNGRVVKVDKIGNISVDKGNSQC